MLRPIRSAALMALLAIASTVSAAETGFYLGAGVGQAYSNLTGETNQSLADAGFSVDSLLVDDHDTDTGWKLFAGYAFNPYLAAELSYVDLGQTGADIIIGGRISGRINTKMTMDGVNIGIKAGYPFADRFSAFAKLGAFVWNAKATAKANLIVGSGTSSQKDNGTDLSYGVGLDYDFNAYFSIRGDWDRYRLGGDADSDASLWSVSVQYQF